MGEAIIKQVNTVISVAPPGKDLSQTWRWRRASQDSAVVPCIGRHMTEAALSACGLTREASTVSQKRLSQHIQQNNSSLFKTIFLTRVLGIPVSVLISVTKTFPKHFRPSLGRWQHRKGHEIYVAGGKWHFLKEI